MLIEWIKAMQIFAKKGYRAITMDVNNKKYSRLNGLKQCRYLQKKDIVP